ncbi:hypothetical protein ACROYT_G016179 [Oculina patagonica]
MKVRCERLGCGLAGGSSVDGFAECGLSLVKTFLMEGRLSEVQNWKLVFLELYPCRGRAIHYNGGQNRTRYLFWRSGIEWCDNNMKESAHDWSKKEGVIPRKKMYIGRKEREIDGRPNSRRMHRHQGS